MSQNIFPPRRNSVGVRVGTVTIGGGAPVVVQSMTNTDTEDESSTTSQVAQLARAGSELVRITVNTPAAAKAVAGIRARLDDMGCHVPLIGDFHFNGHKLVTEYPDCARALAKYRINPGNVGHGKKRDEQFSILIEELNSAVPPVGNEQATARIHCQRVRRFELARPRSLLAPRFDELPILREFHDAGVRVAAMTVGDEDIAVGCDEDVRRLIEGIRTVAGDSCLAKRHQDFSLGTELENLVTLGALSRSISHPYVSLSVDVDSVRADEHPSAKTPYNLAGRIEFEDGRQT